MSRAAILASGTASALGVGESAYAVGGPGEAPRTALSQGRSGGLFGRVKSCDALGPARPQALLALGLSELVQRLDAIERDWRRMKLAVVIGTSSGGLSALEHWLSGTDPAHAASTAQSLRHAAYFSPLSGLSALLGREPDQLVSLYAACASSTLALGLALRWLQLGHYELVITGGYDAESELVSAGFDSLKASSRTVPRPFRAERDGMVLGEGVALLALASEARLTSTPLGYLEGFGSTTDTVHVTAPDRTGAGLARAASLALADAATRPGEVDFVSVHGTGTSFNDAAEAQALLRVFGPAAEDIPLHAFKPIVGHTLGAAGALEVLSALSALNAGLLPATLAQGSPMPEFAARLLGHNQLHAADRCLKLSTAFGGANAALLLAGLGSEGKARAVRTARPARIAAEGRVVHGLELERVRLMLVAPVERLPRSDELSSLAVAAAAEALLALEEQDLPPLDRERTGVIVGSVAATIEADRAFAARYFARGREHAEPRRFPATSPNACAGQVAIAFGLKGPSHSVGAGAMAALEALLVASDWIASGDADAMLVVAAEDVGETACRVFEALGYAPLESGAYAVLLTAAGPGQALVRSELVLAQSADLSENAGFRALEAFCRQARLRASTGFGSVPPPE